uniref:Thioredoxin domain-containing protein n=1 Tax=viral metagenome TaxID=1070528 RepID=A0A6C0BQ36_9ZZZZ
MPSTRALFLYALLVGLSLSIMGAVIISQGSTTPSGGDEKGDQQNNNQGHDETRENNQYRPEPVQSLDRLLSQDPRAIFMAYSDDCPHSQAAYQAFRAAGGKYVISDARTLDALRIEHVPTIFRFDGNELVILNEQPTAAVIKQFAASA